MSLLKDQRKLEDEVQRFWGENNIPRKTRMLRKGKRKFFFVDGPPYATGYIHLGTALNKILKDVFIRFYRMLGYDVWDQPGYDTHGLPIEHKVEEKLGFKTKADIERYGVEKFINECRKHATQFIDVMNKQFENLGVWMNWENPYLTLTNEYIEGAWATFKKAYEKNLLFKGRYPVHVCPRCETAVAYNEIEYRDISDPSIYVKLKVKGREKEYLVVWTTTPWTIPGNTGVMVKPHAKYVRVKVGEEVLVIAERLKEEVLGKLGVKNYVILETLKGRELEGLKYEHPLKDIFPFQRGLKNAHRIVLSDQFVTLDEGTGLVHTAPGHGQEDYKVAQETGLPAISPVNLDGRFNEKCGKFSGMYVKEADRHIIEELKSRNLLLHEEKIMHEYPHCWRCDSPLLLISVPQWFFRVTAIRDKLVKENEKVNWIPKWAGQRFKNWLESLGDWPISRQRFWGIPLPIWICEKCGEVKVIGSSEELPNPPIDFHRPHIDEVVLLCPKCKGKMKRIQDVLDVWFDSGVASWASLGYPRKRSLWRKLWPADFETEGPDQIRGWWNSQLITSVITFDKAPYKTILFHGFVLDAHGIKMAKSRGNIIMPEDVVAKYGRDILRLYLLSSPPWNNFHFNMEEVVEVNKQFNVLKNTYNFVGMYVKGLPKGEVKLLPEDKWIISKLNTTIKKYIDYFKSYQPHKAIQEAFNFILNDFSRWYIKLVRGRVWPLYNGEDKEAAFHTLTTVANETVKLLAPFTPFTAEEIYQGVIKKIMGGSESIHMCDIPKPNEKLIDEKLEKEMELAKGIVEASLATRHKLKLKLRWPVKEIIVVSSNKEVKETVKDLKDIIQRMSNTKSIHFQEKPVKKLPGSSFDQGEVYLNPVEDKEIYEERLYRELTRRIQILRKRNKFKVGEKIRLYLKSDNETNKIMENFKNQFKIDVGSLETLIGELKGKPKGNLVFREKKIEIAFEKIN